MRSRTLSSVGACLAALTLVAFAPGASARTAPSGASHGATTATLAGAAARPENASHTCFKNTSRQFATGADIPSDNYDDPSSPYDSNAADDFTLSTACVAREVDVDGTFDEQSVVDWETVYIFKDVNGRPAPSALWVQSALKGKQTNQPGGFHIKFGPVTLQPGTYWISVQVQLASGQWGWDNTSNASGNPALFENPAGGYPGCSTWTPIQTCFPSTPGPDLMFALKS
jgi:hypothetical protein